MLKIQNDCQFPEFMTTHPYIHIEIKNFVLVAAVVFSCASVSTEVNEKHDCDLIFHTIEQNVMHLILRDVTKILEML